MSYTSPARSRTSKSSPGSQKQFMSSFLSEDRNNELNHIDALAKAQLEHERVRETALRVFQLHELQEENNRILEAQRREQERLAKEASIAEREKKLQELKAKSIPKPTPLPKQPTPEPEPVQEVKQPESTQLRGFSQARLPAALSRQTNQETHNTPTTKSSTPEKSGSIASPFAPTPQSTSSAKPIAPSGLFQQNGIQPSVAAQAPTAAAKTGPAVPPSPATPIKDRYSEIHQALKTLRKRLEAEAKAAGQPLKGQIGDARRVIRVSVGQLTSGKGANVQPINKITAILKEALEGKISSPSIDVRLFVQQNRDPVDGVPNNDAQLPSLFIYLLNMCSKYIINQFINEGGANPKAAEPVGIFAAHIFSNKDFQWRGQSLVDILMAKFRIVCPVLFGFRGNDRTERGRTVLGWRKDGPTWITEQAHNNRMTGLGAGFASVSLRDFSKATKSNPYPPTNYWKALAFILNTPQNEISNTQYVVVRAMVEGHEQRFLNFYGNAAVAALRLALIDFPQKAPQNAAAAASLRSVADVLQNEGLVLS